MLALKRMLSFTTILTSIISVYIGYFFGLKKDKQKTFFDKKVEVYSRIISKISEHRYVKQEDSDNLISVLAPARFFAEKEISEELREYYSLVSEYKDLVNIENIRKEIKDSEESLDDYKEKVVKHSKKISTCIMEIEQLMRKDLGQKRLYTKKEILNHVNS